MPKVVARDVVLPFLLLCKDPSAMRFDEEGKVTEIEEKKLEIKLLAWPHYDNV